MKSVIRERRKGRLTDIKREREKVGKMTETGE